MRETTKYFLTSFSLLDFIVVKLAVKGFFPTFFSHFLIPVLRGMAIECPSSAVPEGIGDERHWDRKIPVTKTLILFF